MTAVVGGRGRETGRVEDRLRTSGGVLVVVSVIARVNKAKVGRRRSTECEV